MRSADQLLDNYRHLFFFEAVRVARTYALA